MTAPESGGPLPLGRPTGTPDAVEAPHGHTTQQHGATGAEPATLRGRIADTLLRVVAEDGLITLDEPDEVDRTEALEVADALLPVFAAELRRLIDEAHATRRPTQITASRIAEVVAERMRELETGTTP